MNRGVLLLLVFLGALVFHLPALRGEFLFYDDARFVVRNDSIEEIGNPARFLTDLDTTASADAPTRDIYRPLRTFSFAVLHAIRGEDPATFHAASIVFHALTAMLLAALLLEVGLSAAAAAAGALFFGLHPATVEATAWICSLGDVQCGFFALAAVLLHARGRFVFAHLALLLALLGKEHAVVVPGLWLAWDWFLRPERWRSGFLRGPLPGLALAVGFLFFRGYVGAGMSQVPEPLGGSTGTAILTMLAGYGFYWSSILFPFGSTVDVRVPVQETLTGPVMLGALLLGLTIAATVFGPRRRRLGFAWFLMALVPVSNVFVTLKIPTADRFLYLPLMGLALVAGELVERIPAPRRWASPVALLLLGALTVSRIGDWRDDRSLIAAGLRANPKSLTFLWAEAGQNAEEATHLLLKRDVQAAQPRYLRAIELYEKLVRAEGDDTPVQVWMELGELHLAWGDEMARRDLRPEAISSYSSSLIAFLAAHQYHLDGRGRVIEEEVYRAADAAATLCVRLAQLESPELPRTVQVGMKLLQYLEKEFGQPAGVRFAQLLLAYSISIRGDQPEKAREGYGYVLNWAEKEREAGRPRPFLEGHALFYQSVLGRSREGILRAYDLYVEAAERDPANRIQHFFYAAQAKCTVAEIFPEDRQTLIEGLRLLDSLEALAKKDRVRISAYLRTKIESLQRRWKDRIPPPPPPPRDEEKDK